MQVLVQNYMITKIEPHKVTRIILKKEEAVSKGNSLFYS